VDALDSRVRADPAHGRRRAQRGSPVLPARWTCCEKWDVPDVTSAPSLHSSLLSIAHRNRAVVPVVYPQEQTGGGHVSPRADIMQGTLDLMVLRTLETLGPLHGWGISQRLQHVSNDTFHLNQGTLYPALVRLEQRGWIRSKWGTSENNRRARYYGLTPAGRRQLAAEREQWGLVSGIINRLLASEE